MASPSNPDNTLVEVQEFEEWYRQNEKDGDQLPYLERAYRQKNGSACLDFGFLTDEKAFTIHSCSDYPKSCILSIKSSLARYSKSCSVVNRFIESNAGSVKLSAIFTKFMDAFAHEQKEPIAGPSYMVTDSDFEEESCSERKSDIDGETDHSGLEDMDIDSQFFNTEFYIEMDLRKKKWLVKEIEFKKKLAVEQKSNWSKIKNQLKKARTSLKSKSLSTVYNTNADDDSSDSDDEKPGNEAPKQGQQIFKHKCATFQILSNEMVSFLHDGKEEGFECDTRDDSLYHWNVKIGQFPHDSLLHEQLKELSSKFGFDYIQIHLDFLPDYPFYPPSLRLVRPRFKGSLNQCLANIYLLKLKYWNPARTIREVLRTIRDILAQNAVIDVEFPGNSIDTKRNGAYLPIEDYLIKLALTADIQPRANGASIDVDNLEKAPEMVRRSEPVNHPSTNETSSNSTTGWKRGAGYGSGAVLGDRQWSPELLIKAQEEKDQQILIILAEILAELKLNGRTDDYELFNILEGSCIIPFLTELLKQASESWIELSRRQKLFSLILKICSSLVNSERLFSLLCLLLGQTKCAAYYFEKLDEIIESGKIIVQISKDTAKKSSARNNAKTGQNESSDNELESENTVLLQQLWKQISLKLKEREWSHVPEPPKQEIEADFESVYISRLKDLQFRTCSFKNYQSGWRHHYWTNDKPKFTKEVMAIFKEWTALKSSLPISSSTSIFVLCDENNVHLLRALIVAPDDTPYANGCFLFDISFPETYPLVPPKVNLQTTGGCRVRFNPNLYNTGKVCLSLLGTWSGEQGEKWNSRSSTILQVLVSIQSLIFHEQPYFNEPGYEKLIGTEKGAKASNDYNKEVRRNCVNFAILEVLTNPPSDFEDVIKLHFSLKKEKVIQQLQQWTRLDRSLEKNVQSVCNILNKL